MKTTNSSNTLFYNGAILTLTGAQSDALLVEDGRISKLGSLEELRLIAGASITEVDLQKKTLMPGFIDAHMHLVHVGLKETGFAIDLSETKSLADTLELVRQHVKERGDGSWIRGRGWDETHWPEKRFITREELDKIAPDQPAVLTRVCGHLLVANSKALEQVTINADADEFDPKLGFLREKAVEEFSAQTKPTSAEIEAAMIAACKLGNSLGITSLHDYVGADYIRAYQNVRSRGKLSLRITMHPFEQYLSHFTELGFKTGFGDEMLKLGAMKFFTDGSVGARNAAFFDPYLDSPDGEETSGKLNYEQSHLDELTAIAHDAGFQLSIHAIGDRAVEAALSAIEAAGANEKDRPRIEHLELPTADQMNRMKDRGVIASMQPNFVQWSGPSGLYDIRLGAERDSQMDPHRLVLDKGIHLSFGSDGMPMNPLFGIHSAVNAPHSSQRISVEEALLAYTYGGAYAGFMEDEVGTLEVGKRADLVVLSKNPHENSENIRDIHVWETYLGGECVFSKEA
jgi:hypothetical protein